MPQVYRKLYKPCKYPEADGEKPPAAHRLDHELLAERDAWDAIIAANKGQRGSTGRGVKPHRGGNSGGSTTGYYDFATRNQVGFATLPAFRGLSEEEYQAKVAGLVREIEEECAEARDGDPVAGVKKILSQDPFRAPTRETKRSPRPLFHFKSREAGDKLRDDLKAFVTQYLVASDALSSGRRQPSSASLFPAGCYPPALPFTEVLLHLDLCRHRRVRCESRRGRW